MKISSNIEFIPKITLEHIDNFKENEKEFKEFEKKNNDKNIQKTNIPSLNEENSKLQWKKKDFTKEYEAAAEFKKKLNLNIQNDPILRDLRALLNMLTEDNYENIKNRILAIIKDSTDNQEKFIDVFYHKATLEIAYIKLFGKLCKELNKETKGKNVLEKDKDITQIFYLKIN